MWKKGLWKSDDSVGNVGLLIAAGVTVALFTVYFFVMPTVKPIYFRAFTQSPMNQEIEFLLQVCILLGVMQTLIMLTLRSWAISLVFWLCLHLIVAVTVAPVLWDVGLLMPSEVLNPGQAFFGLLFVYFLRFVNSDTAAFLMTRGWYY